jgi:hypothetical protein
MKILDIRTNYVDSSPFADMVEGYTFTPYYAVEIFYTDAYLASVKGDRPDRVYVARGHGATESEAELKALDMLVHEYRMLVHQAYHKYYADRGAGMLHIA